MKLSRALYLMGALATSVAAVAVASPEEPVVPDPQAQDEDIPTYSYGELWELQKKFWDNFLYPLNVIQMKSINSTLLDEKVQGRVDATRNFDGRELNTEYLFGLFTDPTRISILGTPIRYKIRHFSANQNIAAASTVVYFNGTISGQTSPLVIDTFIAWNKVGQILQYDAVFRWFDLLLDTTLQGVAAKLGGTVDTAKTYIGGNMAKSICGLHEQHCTGANQQYTDTAECVDFLTTKIRFGQGFDLGRNSLLCRALHEHMIKYRPEVHCSHIGPSGGGMCDDLTSYAQKAEEEHYTNTPFIPYGYSMP